MNTFHRLLIQRIQGAGGLPGDYNFAADILDLAAQEGDGWTSRTDDACRIPDMLGDAARVLRGLVCKFDEE